MPAPPSVESELDEPHRLAIVLTAVRAGAAGVSFPDLIAQLGLSAGNLACHLRRLVRAELVAILCNGARGRARRTRVEITPGGRDCLQAWRAALCLRLAALDRALEANSDPVARAVPETPIHVPGAPSDGEGTSAARVASRGAAATRSLVEERFEGPD